MILIQLKEFQMSFRCEMCGKQVAGGIKVRKIVTTVRDKTNKGYRGMEIAEEKSACPDCGKAEIEPKVVQSDASFRPVITDLEPRYPRQRERYDDDYDQDYDR